MLDDKPVLWVKKNPGAYQMVSDQEGTRLEQSKSILIRVIGTVFFLSLASFTTLISVGIYQEVTSVEDTSFVSGCWNYQTEIILGGNPPFCFDGTVGSVIDSLEVSEDQHIRVTGEDWDSGYTWTEEYRWEDVGDSVVYGFIYEGRYDCVRFIPEFVLEDDWVIEDLDGSFEYPDWCGSSVENQDTRVYEEGAHPYDDVWMYNAYDVGGMFFAMTVEKTTEDRHSVRQYFSKSFVEQERFEWDSQDGQFSLSTLFCTVPITLLLLFAADQRPRVFVVNRQASTLTRRRSGRYPSFSRTWSNINFSATAAVRSVRQRHHSTAATEDSPAQHWTTDHPGVNIVISHGQHQHVLLFFEDGGDVNVHGQTISDFMAAMGVEYHHQNIHDPRAEMFARPTLQYLAESNGARQWNDQTANFIIAWYYESDPNFIQKYPQFENDPEFMLEPYGDRPFKEMYRRPFYEGAGLTTVTSTEDAQRLLDHLLALRQRELTGTEANKSTAPVKSEAPSWNDSTDSSQEPMDKDVGRAVRPGAPSWNDSTDSSQEPMDNGAGRAGEGSTGSFWAIDDAEKP